MLEMDKEVRSRIAVCVRMPCPREERYGLDHIRELGLVDKHGLLDRILGISLEGEDSPQDRRGSESIATSMAGKSSG